jgi:hypothetical protein
MHPYFTIEVLSVGLYSSLGLLAKALYTRVPQVLMMSRCARCSWRMSRTRDATRSMIISSAGAAICSGESAFALRMNSNPRLLYPFLDLHFKNILFKNILSSYWREEIVDLLSVLFLRVFFGLKGLNYQSTRKIFCTTGELKSYFQARSKNFTIKRKIPNVFPDPILHLYLIANKFKLYSWTSK